MKNNMIYELHVGIFILPSGFALLHIFVVMVRISRTIRNMALYFQAHFGHNVFRYIKHTLDILFCQITTFYKSSCGLYFLTSEPVIHRFYKNLSIKEAESQK